ncbi:hypothetical protein [Aestuariicoccus sp. MJ-SS9]|uniref:hypothetical protein n=1 Tax=Aestuariicoccus sp. MJ-SS9 TaxID=3079855 RepID=UPI00290AD861|nr:hypothetical protein [Aestuariicoccus sp. MJ-SS9]MDU8914051.1 hypothetical protein [Aestuariicoccus sp. MJ-SS9]
MSGTFRNETASQNQMVSGPVCKPTLSGPQVQSVSLLKIRSCWIGSFDAAADHLANLNDSTEAPFIFSDGWPTT